MYTTQAYKYIHKTPLKAIIRMALRAHLKLCFKSCRACLFCAISSLTEAQVYLILVVKIIYLSQVKKTFIITKVEMIASQ